MQSLINCGFDMKTFNKPTKKIMISTHTMRILNIHIFIFIVLHIQLKPNIQHSIPQDEQVLGMHYPSSIFLVNVE